MANRNAFLLSQRILPVLLSAIFLPATAGALPPSGGGGSGGGHSGGGGHSSGGHVGSGHSSGRHSGVGHGGGHFGWLHFGFGKHSVLPAEFDAASASGASSYLASRLRNLATTAREPSVAQPPPTLLWSPRPFLASPHGRVTYSRLRPRHPGFLSNRFLCPSYSGCFFDGMTEVCFFEPFLSLLWFSGDFDPSYPGFGFGDDLLDLGDDSGEPMQTEMSAVPPASWEDGAAQPKPSPPRGATTPGINTEGLSKGVFLLVLKNGTSHAVTDYWIADGYLEYISADGTRSHFPLEALDLQSTVVFNAPRGLPFVVRSAPAQDR